MRSHGTAWRSCARIAAPIIGGMISAPLLSLPVIPTIYRMLGEARVQAEVDCRAAYNAVSPGEYAGAHGMKRSERKASFRIRSRERSPPRSCDSAVLAVRQR